MLIQLLRCRGASEKITQSMPETIGSESQQPDEDFTAPETGAQEKGPEAELSSRDTVGATTSRELAGTDGAHQEGLEFSDRTIAVNLIIDGRHLDQQLDLFDLFWNSSSIENIAVTAQHSLGRFGRSPSQLEDRAKILRTILESDHRLQRINLYWELYEKGLQANPSDDKRLIAQNMLDIREEFGLRNMPEDYFDPVRNLLDDYDNTPHEHSE